MTDDAALARELAEKLEQRGHSWDVWISDNEICEVGYSPDNMRYHRELDLECAKLLRTGAIWRAALSELVECKILKERAEQAYNESIRTDLDADLANNYHHLRLHLLKEYERRKALAWDAAKIALDHREREGR